MSIKIVILMSYLLNCNESIYIEISFMIRLIPINPIRPINLLTQNHLHQLMRERHLRERNRIVRPLHDFRCKTKRSADDKRDFTFTVCRQSIEFCRKLFTRPLLSFDSKCVDMNIRSNLR